MGQDQERVPAGQTGGGRWIGHLSAADLDAVAKSPAAAGRLFGELAGRPHDAVELHRVRDVAHELGARMQPEHVRQVLAQHGVSNPGQLHTATGRGEALADLASRETNRQRQETTAGLAAIPTTRTWPSQAQLDAGSRQVISGETKNNTFFLTAGNERFFCKQEGDNGEFDQEQIRQELAAGAAIRLLGGTPIHMQMAAVCGVPTFMAEALNGQPWSHMLQRSESAAVGFLQSLPRAAIEKVLLRDFLIGADDRHSGNFFVKDTPPPEIHSLDHEFSWVRDAAGLRQAWNENHLADDYRRHRPADYHAPLDGAGLQKCLVAVPRVADMLKLANMHDRIPGLLERAALLQRLAVSQGSLAHLDKQIARL